MSNDTPIKSLEQWVIIPHYPKYEVSQLGNVRRINGKPLKQSHSVGYKVVALYNETGRKMFKVHRLVMAGFYGESLLQVNHIDCDKTNNNINNLEYCTPRENTQHLLRTKGRRSANGVSLPVSKLTDAAVLEIIKLRRNGKLLREIADYYSVSESVISEICSGKSWKHVDRI